MTLEDARVRMAAFRWLAEQVDRTGSDVLPWSLLRHGFEVAGRRIPLVAQRGIFKPSILEEIPLSITTSPRNPYDDAFPDDKHLAYHYFGEDPRHRDNVGLRRALETRTPLIYFHGIEKGLYLAVWPVFVVGEDPGAKTFLVQADTEEVLERPRSEWSEDATSPGRRDYITATVRRRVHQRGFRERVLRAYRRRCALCRLRETPLLDAAHITPDSEESGEPVVSNGIALCKLHHAAFDRFLIAITPRYRVEVHRKVLAARDGPMLEHGLKGLHDKAILLPSRKEAQPDRDRLAERYARFRQAL